jgi:TetR/AcrR family transcriptional regulator
MRRIRDAEKTRDSILDAASHEFAEKGFHGTNLSIIAQRAKVSKQLLNYHFPSKEELLDQVIWDRFRPSMQWEENIAEVPSELILRSFLRRSQEPEYIRYLTWEAANRPEGKLPREEVRLSRVKRYGEGIRQHQANGLIPEELDPQLLHLAVLCLSTYPLAFSHIAKMVTGMAGDSPEFKERWSEFVQLIASKILVPDTTGAKAKNAASAKD